MTKLYEAKDHILLQGAYGNPAEHRHMAVHMIVSLHGMMKVVSNGTEYLCRGVMIPAGTSHVVDTYGEAVLVFLYDCTTDVARQIRCVQTICEESCEKIAQLYASFERAETTDGYRAFEQGVLDQLGLKRAACCVTDERIRSAIACIRSGLAEELSCQSVANAVHLSQSRFSHLFRQQVGMTFASYLIYQRIMSVYAGILRGDSITESALAAGFSSSSHFADVNRRVFGISASKITRDMTFVKV